RPAGLERGAAALAQEVGEPAVAARQVEHGVDLADGAEVAREQRAFAPVREPSMQLALVVGAVRRGAAEAVVVLQLARLHRRVDVGHRAWSVRVASLGLRTLPRI